ncbi:pilus assembly protein [Zoogloea sp.]|uniref:pilus assembly protein n=1 Tax=Zoogloea sp. TaxID=49181 RepID=UPI0031FE41C6
MKPRFIPTATAVSLALLVGACSTTPAFDEGFGVAARALALQQTRDLAATERNADRPVDGIEGQAASGVMSRYYQSFTKPPAPENVFNIGVGTGRKEGQ